MNRKLIALNLALLALAGALVWILRARWLDEQARERALLAQKIAARAVLAPASPSQVKPVAPGDYLDVAQKMLFSKDRNPAVVIDVPAPKPEPPMPSLPSYYGEMAFGDPVVLLSVQNGQQKAYHAGEKVGEFQLVSFDREKIALDWNGKRVERKLAELIPKETPQPVAQAQPAQAPRPLAAAPVTSLASAQAASLASNATFGPDLGSGMRACTNSSDSAGNGTIVDGYKKIVAQTMFGPSCHWEKVDASK